MKESPIIHGSFDGDTKVGFSRANREILRIVPTETGFDIKIPEGIEPTEAAEEFIKIVRELLAKT